ncbi:MAG TPA: T9SS type A sorting domain-containing protein [Bacteroidia bacterium]|nr:T9SS type A sorting domain-containing protein [Bacteroidia bacterium]
MIKKLLFTVSIFASVFCLKAQTWSTYGNGIGPWSAGQVFGITTYNGNLFVTGVFSTAGNDSARSIAQWNGTTWDSVGGGIDGAGYALCEYNGKLVLGGQLSIAGGNAANNIAQWNGTLWSALGSGINGIANNTYVYSLCVFNGNLYAGGVFNSAGGNPANNIAEWNGASWSALSSGIATSAAEVSFLAVYNGELYAAGYFDTAGGVPVNNIAKWNGSSWSAVGSGITGYNGRAGISSLAVLNGELYACGVFDTAGGMPVNNIAKWNGTSWSAVGKGIRFGPSPWGVSSLTVLNHVLYAGGGFDSAGGVAASDVAQWDGANWYPLGSGIPGYYVYSLGSYGSALVAGGNISQAGNISCSNIADWTGGPPSEINICYVSVDTASKYNEVLWDKTGIDTNLVDSVRIYSKNFSGYQYIGHVSIHNYTQFVDSNSQPNTVSSYYEICTVDTNGLISLLSPYNQTILLQASVGVGNVVNLTWNAYQGDSVDYYVILRDSAGSNNWQRLDSVSNTTFAYTDNHPPVSANLRYMIITVWSLHCVPYSNAPIVRHELMSANKVTSRSNRKELAITGVPTINSIPSLSIYPNPSKSIVTITLSQPETGIVTVNDVLGQTIYTDRLNGNVEQINLSGVRSGVYFLKLALNNGGELVRKIEVVK